MARITVEDCLENVENRFELVMLATRRLPAGLPNSAASSLWIASGTTRLMIGKGSW